MKAIVFLNSLIHIATMKTNLSLQIANSVRDKMKGQLEREKEREKAYMNSNL